MIGPRSVNRELEAWLAAEAPVTAPAGLHDAAMEQARRARQRPGWLVAMRGGTMETVAGHTARPTIRLGYLLAILGLILAIVGAALAGGAPRLSPPNPFAARNGSIAYSVSDISGRPYMHAHVMNSDGSSDVNIGQGSCPAYSGDGRVLSFKTGWSDTAALNVAAADGSDPRPVPDVGDESWALSPDGIRVAWLKSLPAIVTEFPDGSSNSLTPGELWVAQANGEGAIRLATPNPPEAEQFSFPIWSPDGASIAFAISRWVTNGDDSGIYRTAIDIVAADGSGRTRLTSRIGTDTIGISWSPDSMYLAFTALPDGSPTPSLNPSTEQQDSFNAPQDIFVVQADGTGERNMTTTPVEDIAPHWSPDGTRLGYVVFDAGAAAYRLTIVGIDGSVPTGSPVTGPVGQDFIWSPDGTMLAWIESDGGGNPTAIPSRLKAVDVGFDRPIVTLTESPSLLSCPSWQHLDP